MATGKMEKPLYFYSGSFLYQRRFKITKSYMIRILCEKILVYYNFIGGYDKICKILTKS